MRLGLWFTIACLAGGCDNGKQHLHPEAGPIGPLWWQPEPGATRNWDIQLAAPFDLSAERQMYVLDLWDLAPATTVDYGDGDPVAVPAGALDGKLAELKTRTPAPIVICRVRTGAIRLSEPDARKFPGFEATPPDRPTMPTSGSAIGWSTQDPRSPDERFLDIRDASRAAWAPLIDKRLDLAKQIGCDGVDADRNEMVTSDPGWTITAVEQTSWYREVAGRVHDRLLSAGMRNGTALPPQFDELAQVHDWLLIERCAEFTECDFVQAFLNNRHPVFAVDYQNNSDGDPQSMTGLCSDQQFEQIDEGLIKDDALSSAFRYQCVP